MRVAFYHPWIYLKSGIERTILEVDRLSRHEWTFYTSHFDAEATYPELKNLRVVELSRVPVRRSYGAVIRGAVDIATTRLDPSKFDVLVISCEGLGDLMTLRNTTRPVACLCFTPLRAIFDPEYRARLLERVGPMRPFALMAEAAFRLIDRFCWRRYGAVAAISGTIRDRIVDGGLRDKADITILNPGIRTEDIAPSDRWEPYFLIPGRIMWTKNIELGLEAFAQARERLGPEWRLVIAGMVDAKSQPYLAKLRARAEQIGGVEFRIGPSDQELRGLYQGCSAVLFTAFNEDWGLTPLEGMAAGKPVIAVDRGGPRETILHEQTGFLELDKPERFADRMAMIAADQALAQRLGMAGAAHVKNFTWDVFVDGLDAMVDGLVRDRGTHG